MSKLQELVDEIGSTGVLLELAKILREEAVELRHRATPTAGDSHDAGALLLEQLCDELAA